MGQWTGLPGPIRKRRQIHMSMTGALVSGMLLAASATAEPPPPDTKGEGNDQSDTADPPQGKNQG